MPGGYNQKKIGGIASQHRTDLRRCVLLRADAAWSVNPTLVARYAAQTLI